MCHSNCPSYHSSPESHLSGSDLFLSKLERWPGALLLALTSLAGGRSLTLQQAGTLKLCGEEPAKEPVQMAAAHAWLQPVPTCHTWCLPCMWHPQGGQSGGQGTGARRSGMQHRTGGRSPRPAATACTQHGGQLSRGVARRPLDIRSASKGSNSLAVATPTAGRVTLSCKDRGAICSTQADVFK